MIPTDSEGQGHIEFCDRPLRHGRLLRRPGKVVPGMRVVVTVVVVLAVLTVVVIVLMTDIHKHPHRQVFSDGKGKCILLCHNEEIVLFTLTCLYVRRFTV